MIARLFSLGATLPLLLCGGCWSQQNRQLLESGGLRLIPATTFLHAQPGMSRSQVATLFRSPGRHEFTIRCEGADYLCVNYMPEPAEIDLYYFVFRNDALWKIVDRPGGGFSGQSQPFAHPNQAWPPASGTARDEQRASRIIADGLDRTPEQMRARIENAKSWLRKWEKSEWNIPIWLWGITYMVDWPRMQFKIWHNAELDQRQNGSRLSLGMSADQVARFLGPPTGREGAQHGRCAVLYGQSPDLRLVRSDEFEARRVAVIFEDGKAVAIFSHDFAPAPQREDD